MLKSRLSVLLAAAVLPLAGCGSDSGAGGTGADPAKVVPAGAPLYFEVVARPEGDQRDGARDALKKLLRTDDPDKKVVDLFNKVAGEESITWDELKGWLGPRVGIYFSDFSGEQPVGAVIADMTDADKANATLKKLTAKADGEAASAIVGDYAVFGTPAGVQAVQATAKGGKALAATPDFTAARDAVATDEGLASAYVAPQGLIDALAKMQPSSGADSPFGDEKTLDVLRQLMAKAGRAAAMSFHADGDALRVEAAAIGAPAGEGSTAAADALAGLPADAWLAVGFGDLGKAATDALAQLSQLAALAEGTQGAPDFEALFKRFQRRTGVDIRKDFLSWMGDGAIYVRGRTIADIGGVITIKSKDADKSRRAVGILAQALAKAGMNTRAAKIAGYDVAIELRSAQAPISFFIAANGERFSLGVNPKAMTDVLDPSDKLGDSDTYDKAVDAMGGEVKPVVLLDTPTIIGLIESFGIGQAEEYAKVKPYLDAIGPLSAGMARDGDVSRFALALGLR